MTHRMHRRPAVVLTALLCSCSVAAAADAQATPHPAPARSARVLKATDTAHLHYTSASGSILQEEGKATGSLPGSMHVRLDLGTTFTGTFKIYAAGGSIEGRGIAKPHGSGIYESFAGTLTVTHGTGRYAHAHGKGGLYGTFNRNSYALVVKTTGSLTY
jgi:hypothetical protein